MLNLGANLNNQPMVDRQNGANIIYNQEELKEYSEPQDGLSQLMLSQSQPPPVPNNSKGHSGYG